jgi:hypothetical protein
VTTLTTLVTGKHAAAREAAIAGLIEPGISTALLLEGLPDGTDRFSGHQPETLSITRIAPGCFCCTGNLTMVVTLNRLLQQRPERLYISVATNTHLAGIEQLLSAPPYDAWLAMTDTLDVGTS